MAIAGKERAGGSGRMTPEPATSPGHRFPVEVMHHAVWLYHVFSLSLRDVELVLAERGITVAHESNRGWCLKFGQDFAARRRRAKPGDTWHVDEVFLRSGDKLNHLSLARGRPARGRAGHPGAGAVERHRGQTLLQAAASWAAVQAGRRAGAIGECSGPSQRSRRIGSSRPRYDLATFVRAAS
jgi:hypothetical protein